VRLAQLLRGVPDRPAAGNIGEAQAQSNSAIRRTSGGEPRGFGLLDGQIGVVARLREMGLALPMDGGAGGDKPPGGLPSGEYCLRLFAPPHGGIMERWGGG